MIAALALATPGIAATLDGSTGLVRLPNADTVGAGRVAASVGLQWARGYGGASLEALPVGFAAGVTRRVEVGGHVDRDLRSPRPEGAPARASAGFHLRIRSLDPIRGRPGLAFQGALVGVGASAAAEGSAIAVLAARRSTFVLAGGPRLDARGVSGWAGAGLQGGVGTVGLAAEQRVRVGEGALQQLDGRIGVTFRVRDRASLLAWGGGGASRGAPWLGGGLALQLASSDPRRRDVDGDTVPDWTDRCRFEPEDLDAFEDLDGCPDPDNDADGVPDLEDPTPNGEPEPDEGHEGPTPTLKMRIKPRRLPGPIDPARRQEEARDGTP